jgi:hypothetical protein
LSLEETKLEEARIIISDNIELFDRAERYYRAKRAALFRLLYAQIPFAREYLRRLTPRERVRALRTIVRERRLAGRFVSYETQAYARDILAEEKARAEILKQISELKSLLLIGKFEDLVNTGIEVKEREIELLDSIARSFRKIRRYDWAERTEALKKEVEKNLEELRKLIPWRYFVYVVSAKYEPTHRHVEFHFQGICSDISKVKEKCIDLAKKLLYDWVHSPQAMGYDVVYDMAEAFYKGWTIGEEVKWDTISDGALKSVPITSKPDKALLKCLVYDYNRAIVRVSNEAEKPPEWWRLRYETLLRNLGVVL